MRRAARWTVLSVLCLFGTQEGQAQPAECGGDYVCIQEASLAAVT